MSIDQSVCLFVGSSVRSSSVNSFVRLSVRPSVGLIGRSVRQSIRLFICRFVPQSVRRSVHSPEPNQIKPNQIKSINQIYQIISQYLNYLKQNKTENFLRGTYTGARETTGNRAYSPSSLFFLSFSPRTIQSHLTQKHKQNGTRAIYIYVG